MIDADDIYECQACRRQYFGSEVCPCGSASRAPVLALPAHKLNSDQTVAVATDYYWLPIDANTPRGVKLQLLGEGGVACYGEWNGKDTFWKKWAPLPKNKD